MKKYDGTPSKKKFKGYNFYIQCNERLSKKNRENLLRTSPIYLGEVFSSLPLSTDKLVTDGLVGELDSNLTDIELLEQWNPMYDVFGYLMSEFRTKWEKERTKEYKFQTFQKSEDYKMLSERLSKMETEFNMFKLKMNKPMLMMG
jgi:hypothetical protein|tara:strand:- start:62 stop:496 length:435 start_codon:yes stop_codon:yes gene_type:complete